MTDTTTATERVSKELENLIAAKFPVIAIESSEEARVIRTLELLAAKGNRQVILWSCVRGLHRYDKQPGKTREIQVIDGDAVDPFMALEKILDRMDNDGNTLYVFLDLHPFMNDPRILRSIREIAKQYVHTLRRLVLISSQVAIPRDIEKDVVLVDFPLPDRAEMHTMVLRAIEQVPDGKPIRLKEGESEQIATALTGLTEQEALTTIRKAFVVHNGFSIDALQIIIETKKDIIRKSGVLEYYDPSEVKPEDIGGHDLLKEYIALTNGITGEAAAAFGATPGKGIIIAGVHGTGKSLSIRIVGGGLRPILNMDIGALKEGLVGASQANLRYGLRVARAVQGIVWIDEGDKTIGGLSSGAELDGGTSMDMFAALLTFMQETPGEEVYFAVTANDATKLDAAFMRRFDAVFFVDLPSFQDRKDIFAIHIKKRRRNPEDFDLAALSTATEAYTGAEIEKIIEQAIRVCWKDGARVMTTQDLLNAVPSQVPISRSKAKQIKELRAWASENALPASSHQATGKKVGGTSIVSKKSAQQAVAGESENPDWDFDV